MGVELTNNAGETFEFTNTAWFRLLEFTLAHGWKSDVACEPGSEPEAFSAELARNLADTLERAMGPGDDAEVARRVSQELTRLLVTPSESPMFPNDPVGFEPR